MTSSLYFDKNNSPDLLDVSLKGEMLGEFLKSAEIKLKEIEKASQAQSPEVFAVHVRKSLEALGQVDEQVIKNMRDGFAKQQQHNVALVNSIFPKIIAQLSGDKARQYGLDMADLKALIYSKSGVHLDTAGNLIDTTSEYAAQAADSAKKHIEMAMEDAPDTAAPDQEIQRENLRAKDAERNDAMLLYAISGYLMHAFSKCVAVQEHRQNDFIGLMEKTMPDAFAFFNQNIENVPELQNAKSLFIAAQQLDVVIDYQEIKNRGSKLAPLEHDIVFGNAQHGGLMKIFRQELAKANHLDLQKKADTEQLRRLEQGLLKQVAAKKGVAIPSMPEF